MAQEKFLPPSERTRVRRIAYQANYDPNSVYAIVDESYLCHLAFQDDKGTHCIPMACWRQDDHLYIHGSNGSRLIKQLGSSLQVCVSITHLDGLVLARSAFNHSMNYRSAVIYGCFERVTNDADKHRAMDAFMDKIAPGRNSEIRRGSKKEMASTTVLRMSLAEAAAKIRSGGPVDDAEDMAIPVWAGVLPLALTGLAPVADAGVEIDAPDYVKAWQSS